MTLHLTGCTTTARDPGFSRSECADLARRIESGDLIVGSEMEFAEGGSGIDEIAAWQRDTIIAALRAFAA